MKKIIRNISCLLIVVMIIIFNSNIWSASIGMSISKSTAYVGDSFTVSISGINGKVNITSSGNLSLSISGITFVDGSLTINGTAKSVGNGSVTVSPIDVTTTAASPEEITSSSSVNISVSEKKTTNNNTKTTTTAKTNTAKTTNNTSTKSSNNYLKSLQVSEEGLTPNFLKTKTNYSLNVGLKVTNLDVTAVAEDSKAKVSVTGNKDLKEGDNNVVITVTAENGSQRTYTIIVNKSDKPEKSNSYLANLIIRDITLTPEFSSEVLEYDGGVIKTNDTTLEIFASPTNENAKVEILGNENLILGENIITIKVTSEDGTSTKEYKVKFVREEGVVEEVNAIENIDNIESPTQGFKAILKDIWTTIKNNSLILLMYLVIIVEFIQILYLYNKLRKNEKNTSDDGDKNKKSFDQFNIKLDDSKLEEKPLIESLPDEKISSLSEGLSEEKVESEIEQPKEDSFDEEIERKVRTIWDEDRPNFLENEVKNTEITKRRRGRTKFR